MKKNLYIFFAVLNSFSLHAQDYVKQIEQHRKEYIQEFAESDRSPLNEADILFLRFFDPDEQYRVVAQFKKTVDALPFDMATYSGAVKKYVKYGTLTFSVNGHAAMLNVYQGSELIKKPEYKDYLFLPFKDFTNGVQSYGGGRYLDFVISDIKGDTMMLDFNKAYNPYCAYSAGYSCPIPPEENHLSFEIMAGEKQFAKE